MTTINNTTTQNIRAGLMHWHCECDVQITNLQVVKNGYLVQFTVIPNSKEFGQYEHDRVAFFKEGQVVGDGKARPEWNFNV